MTEKPFEPPHGRTPIQFPKRKPIQCVNDANGHPVLADEPSAAYLCFDRATGRYYLVPSKPKVYFGNNLDAAVWRFRAYVEQRTGGHEVEYVATVPYGSPPHWNMRTGFQTRVKATLVFPELEAYKFVAAKILNEPKEAARLLRIPEIERLTSLPKPAPSATLSQCLEVFRDKRRRISEEERGKIESAWTYFTERVRPATTLADVNEARFDVWVKACWISHDDGGSPSTLHHRIERVRRVIRYASEKKGVDPENCGRLLTWIRRLELPPKRGEAPSPLSTDEWERLYRLSKGTQWEPMLVTMLNCCFYGCDIRRLPVTAIDFKARTIVFDREKKGTPRVAVLWKTTTRLLKTWLAEHPSKTTFFLSQCRTGYAAEGLRTAFRLFREKVALPNDVTLNRVRDSAYTAAIVAGSVPARILAGHRMQGESDAYVRRNPELTRPAVEAIGTAYGFK